MLGGPAWEPAARHYLPVVSTDVDLHALRILVPVDLATPGTVILSGSVDMVGQIAAGHITADGTAILASAGA